MNMSRFKYKECKQGTEEWLEVKEGCVGGSGISAVIERRYAFGNRYTQAVKSLRIGELRQNQAMKHGNKHESKAAEAASHIFKGLKLEERGWAILCSNRHVGVSPDRVIPNASDAAWDVICTLARERGHDPSSWSRRGGLEIKCPWKYRNRVPPYKTVPVWYMDQLQLCMHVLSCDWWILLIWSPKGHCVWVVERDDTWWEFIKPCVHAFQSLVSWSVEEGDDDEMVKRGVAVLKTAFQDNKVIDSLQRGNLQLRPVDAYANPRVAKAFRILLKDMDSLTSHFKKKST